MNAKTFSGSESVQAAEMRRKAEERLRASEASPAEAMSVTDARALVHELQVHQIELEMQNEELQRARLEAEEASEKYYDLFDFAPVAYFLWDHEGRILEVNLAGAALLGLDRSAASQKRFGQFVAAEFRNEFTDFLKRVSATTLMQTCKVKVQRDGFMVWVLIEGIAAGGSPGPQKLCRAAVIDVTQQKRADELAETNRALQSEIAARQKAEHALQESQLRLTIFAEATFEGIVESEEGRIVDCNEQLARMLGYSVAELRGMEIVRLIAPEDRDWVMASIRQGRESTTEHTSLRKDGARIVVEAHGRPVSPGSVRRLTAVRDISDRKRAEEALLQAKAAAEQANRAKDHFLAVLSHELRTPLTPVVMGVSVLQDRSDLAPDVLETLEMIGRSIATEARLIDDLLDVSRIARGKIELHKQRVALCSVIRQAAEVCKPDMEARRLHFAVDMGPAAPYWVEADASRLQQVFWNLLKNAIKFTPHEGCVGIRCRPDCGHVLVEVNDSGIGIEQEALTRVFNAFEQEERSITRQFGGLGLGLAISKALLEMHGGTIEAQSEGRNKGATFRIRLPLVSPVAQQAAQPPAVAPPAAVRPLRVLLVEDHPVTAKMMQAVLSANGHTVRWAGDIATALELAGRDDFDLLVSDLGLPDGSGYDLMRQLRQRGLALPGVALSGYGQEEDIQRSREAGFAAHVTKPASREAVLAAVAAVTAGEIGTSLA